MSDDFRDRIAWPIWQNSTLTPEATAHIAQTIIADLGLVVERTVRVVDYGAGEVRIPERRVVGKWEHARRAPCGCDLSGVAPPAIHIVDGHEDNDE